MRVVSRWFLISRLSPLFGCGNAHVITRAKKLDFKQLCKALVLVSRYLSTTDLALISASNLSKLGPFYVPSGVGRAQMLFLGFSVVLLPDLTQVVTKK